METASGLQTKMATVVAIPGYQFDYIWNELKSIIGSLTYDPDLESGDTSF